MEIKKVIDTDWADNWKRDMDSANDKEEQHKQRHRVQISHYLNLWQLMCGHGVVWDDEKEERYSCFWEISTDDKVYFDGGKGFCLAAHLDDVYVDIESMSLNVTGIRLDKEDKPIEEHELDIYIRPYCPTIK